jgi:hypothetical protein
MVNPPSRTPDASTDNTIRLMGHCSFFDALAANHTAERCDYLSHSVLDSIYRGPPAPTYGFSLDHPAIWTGPVPAMTGEGPVFATVDDDQGAVAVILDLVNPGSSEVSAVAVIRIMACSTDPGIRSRPDRGYRSRYSWHRIRCMAERSLGLQVLSPNPDLRLSHYVL